MIPPFWHRNDEVVCELSALHLHWLNCYHEDGSASGPHTWHRDFAEARNRLREWVAICGTRLDRDRPTRQTAGPGEAPHEPGPESVIADRDEDFIAFVTDDVNGRIPNWVESTRCRAIQCDLPSQSWTGVLGKYWGVLWAPTRGDYAQPTDLIAGQPC